MAKPPFTAWSLGKRKRTGQWDIPTRPPKKKDRVQWGRLSLLPLRLANGRDPNGDQIIEVAQTGERDDQLVDGHGQSDLRERIGAQ
jgi:hypothetical protein